jgi:hypothetical protein
MAPEPPSQAKESRPHGRANAPAHRGNGLKNSSARIGLASHVSVNACCRHCSNRVPLDRGGEKALLEAAFQCGRTAALSLRRAAGMQLLSWAALPGGQMAEEVPATPGWVEQQLDEIWSSLYLPVTEAITAFREDYLTCLATCVFASDYETGRDNCREDFISGLRRGRIASDTLEFLEAELGALEAEITERT